MSSSESSLKTRLVKECREMGAYARRIEDQFGVGLLDIVVAFDDTPVMFVEGKLTDGYWIRPTDRQFVEGTRIWKIKGGFCNAVLVGWNTKGRMFVTDWTSVAAVHACFRQEEQWNYGQTLREFALEQYRRSNRHSANQPR